MRGFPNFKYVESLDPFVIDHLGCAFNPAKEKFLVGKGYPDELLIFVSQELPKNFRKIIAAHEYADGSMDSHAEGLKLEKRLAKILGEEERWKRFRLDLARRRFRKNHKMWSMRFVGDKGRKECDEFFTRITKDNAEVEAGIPIGWFRRNIKDIMSHKRKLEEKSQRELNKTRRA